MCWLGCIPPRREEGPALGVSTSLACIRVVPPRTVVVVVVVVAVVVVVVVVAAVCLFVCRGP